MFFGVLFKLLPQVGVRKESFAFKLAVNLGTNVTGKSDISQLTAFELLLVAYFFAITPVEPVVYFERQNNVRCCYYSVVL